MVGNLAVKSVMNNSLYSGTTLLQSGGGISTHSRRKLILPGDLIFFWQKQTENEKYKVHFCTTFD